ncbi:hypothetical protein N7527_002266 [Penicillium freii]|nr:hypothetical protein N7527_002266 [Penicillium freii]
MSRKDAALFLSESNACDWERILHIVFGCVDAVGEVDIDPDAGKMRMDDATEAGEDNEDMETLYFQYNTR